MSDEEGFAPDEDELEAEAVAQFLQGLEITSALMEGMQAALAEFTESRWPHLVAHGVVDADNENIFTNGATALFITMGEIGVLTDMLEKLREDEALPDMLCPLASTLRGIRRMAKEGENVINLSNHIQRTERPPNPEMN